MLSEFFHCSSRAAAISYWFERLTIQMADPLISSLVCCVKTAPIANTFQSPAWQTATFQPSVLPLFIVFIHCDGQSCGCGLKLMRLRNRPMYNLSGATAWKQRTMRLGASWCSEESQICIPDTLICIMIWILSGCLVSKVMLCWENNPKDAV